MKISKKIEGYCENKEWTMKAPGKQFTIDRGIQPFMISGSNSLKEDRLELEHMGYFYLSQL